MVSSNYPPRVGGPATTVPEISKRLSEKGYIISVLTAHVKDTPYFDHNQYFKVYRAPSTYIGGFQHPFSVGLRTFSMGCLGRIIASRNNIEVIHAHDTNISVLASLMIQKTSFRKIPLIVKYAGDLALEYIGMSSNSLDISLEKIKNDASSKQRLLYKIQKLIFDLCDIIHVQNEFQRHCVKDLYKIQDEKIKIVPNPVDIQRFKQFNKQKDKRDKDLTLMTISRLVPWKGIHNLFNAMPIIIDKIGDHVKLFVIGEGEGDYEYKLRMLCKKLKLDKNIVFLGKVPNPEIPDYLKNCDVFVQPSLYEPFGISIIEAMACACAVVATNTGGVPEIITNGVNGILVEPNNVDELAEKIVTLLQDEELRNKLGINARKRVVDSYSYENITAEFESLYVSLLK